MINANAYYIIFIIRNRPINKHNVQEITHVDIYFCLDNICIEAPILYIIICVPAETHEPVDNLRSIINAIH